jgi:hypothetical protein
LARCAAIITVSWAEPETHSLAEGYPPNLYASFVPYVDPAGKIHDAAHYFFAQYGADCPYGQKAGVILIGQLPALPVASEACPVVQIEVKAAHDRGTPPSPVSFKDHSRNGNQTFLLAELP